MIVGVFCSVCNESSETFREVEILSIEEHSGIIISLFNSIMKIRKTRDFLTIYHQSNMKTPNDYQQYFDEIQCTKIPNDH